MHTRRRVQNAIDTFSFLSDVHVVGGAVRDMVIRRDSDDIDLATSDRPEEAKSKCEEEGMKVIETGIHHGTITAISDGRKFEITTFRRDVSTDGRNATVEFADSIEEDLERRDFTMNAMAFDGDKLVDPHGGLLDIENELVRTVGNPERRFREDLLRVIRASRFASRFGFEIGDLEKEEMRKAAPEVVDNVSVERIFMEINKALRDENPVRFLEDLRSLGVLEDVLGESVDPIPPIDNLEDHSDRLVAFLVFLGDDTDLGFGEIQEALKLPNGLVRDSRKVFELLTSLSLGIEETERRKLLADNRDVLDLSQRVANALDVFLLSLLDRPDNVSLAPVVTGQDLIDEGFEEGPEIGNLMDEAHRIQLSRGIEDKDVLLSLLTQA